MSDDADLLAEIAIWVERAEAQKPGMMDILPVSEELADKYRHQPKGAILELIKQQFRQKGLFWLGNA